MEAKRAESRTPQVSDWDEEHPSYANIEINRMQCGRPQNLFGSPVKHSQIICLKISSCKATRSLNDTHYFSGKHYIEVWLSPVQLADLITRMNSGGTPCTLRYFQGEEIDDCPQEKPTETMQAEFDNEMEKLKSEIFEIEKEVKKVLEDSRISTKSKDKVMEIIGKFRNKLKHTYPFIAEQFAKQMNKTASAAKAEADAFITNLIHRTGIKELGMEISNQRIESSHQITAVDELKEKLNL